MRVLLDATAIPADLGGVGRYVDNLVPALVRSGQVELTVVCQHRDAERYAQLSGRPAVVAPEGIARRPVRLLWEQTGLVGLLRRLRPDVLHSPHYTQPLLARRVAHVPTVVTLHDATFFSDPHLHTKVKGPFFRTATRLALREAAVCILPSQATADELVRHAAADPARLRVAHHGVDHDRFRIPTPDEVAAARVTVGLDPDEPYVAFLGTIEPRKNVPALIRAWIEACAGRPNPPALVLAGAVGWDDDVDSVASQVPSGLKLVRAGYVPFGALPGLLGGALAVCYPSLGEGFGLPVLEAMACGAPVVTTRRLSLPEVGGDAVLYTDVDAKSIASALGTIIDDPQLRARLARDGQARAAAFTWDACAAVHLESFRQAMAVAA